MGAAVSLILLAAGAVLTFAVETEVSGVSLDVLGLIVMVAGALGLVAAMAAAGPLRVRHERPVDR